MTDNANPNREDETITIQRLSADQIPIYLDDLMNLLKNAVDGGASVNFIPPLDLNLAHSFWTKVHHDVSNGEKIVLAAIAGEHVIGSIQLGLALQPNGIHRAEVQKLLVHSTYRRRGIGKNLLIAIEDVAHQAGRSLLVLDTEKGSDAERLYARQGYFRAGEIPGYALGADRQLISTVIFYRHL